MKHRSKYASKNAGKAPRKMPTAPMYGGFSNNFNKL